MAQQTKSRTDTANGDTATLDPVRAEREQMYSETLKNFAEGSIVPGKILEIRSNEILVDIGYKSEGAIPSSEFADLEALKLGDSLDVLLETIEDEDGMVVLSKEKAELQIRWERVVEQYEEGSLVEGVVRSKVRGGLIVDVDGVEAFLPGSQVDVMPTQNLDVHMGKTYECRIIKISHDRRNIVLSRRELIEERLAEKRKALLTEIKIGQTRKGVAKNITDFGVFVDLNGMDGLLHITDMSWGRINHPSEMVRVGDPMEVVILDIDLDKERVSLGLKQKVTNPWITIDEKFPVGSRQKGKIVNLAPYGAFVELEKGVEGLVHVSEISWTKRIARAADVLTVGEEVEVVVLNINKEEQKIALGIRQTEENPWDQVEANYPPGSRVSGPVRNFTSYGAFVEIEEGIDGMIHVSDMSWTRKINHPSEVVKKGEEIEAVVLEVDRSNQRISLGIKQAQDDPWNDIVSRYNVGQIVTGTVTKLAAFGAFVEIEEGIDGLVHISQISDQHVEKVKDALKVGDGVEARIVKIDPAGRRIGLSIKAAKLPDDEFEQQQDEIMEILRPGDNMVDFAGALDEAMLARDDESDVWRPGEEDSTGDRKSRRKPTHEPDEPVEPDDDSDDEG
jgi:small subunit ribosomal protein S1|tara:strand:- start:372 stop:2228 length:1857 start_codon:yes stop_codon:yes gene_type:complete